MGAGGALGCVSAGGVAERDGGGARDHLGEAAEANARCACDAGARAQAGDCRAEGAAGGTCAEEKLIMPLARLNSRRSLALPVASGAQFGTLIFLRREPSWRTLRRSRLPASLSDFGGGGQFAQYLRRRSFEVGNDKIRLNGQDAHGGF